MTPDAVHPRSIRARDQKPTALKTSPTSVIFVLALLSCGTTPIQAVIADRGTEHDDGSGGDGGTNAREGETACDEPSAGRFILNLGKACLRRGAATTAFGNAAFLTELSADCRTARAQWDLTPALEGTFTLRDVEDQLSLDARGASAIPGTPLIVYDPNTLDNQRFWFRSRSDETYELAPRHAPTLCAEAQAEGLEIWPCDTNDTAQAFRFARVSCP